MKKRSSWWYIVYKYPQTYAPEWATNLVHHLTLLIASLYFSKGR